MNKKLFVMIACFMAATVAFVSCKEKEKEKIVNVPAEVFELTGTYTASKTLDATKIWTLKGRAIFAAGTTLTIPAGTIIKAAGGTGVNAAALIIARGAKIIAEGTAAKPIIFTTVVDDIAIGQIVGSNLDAATIRGLWGGLIVLGDAPISPKSGNTAQIEGIPADVIAGNYGGNNAADNSGVIKFVSIRHGGALIGDANEINGLTLGGVGSGTVIENVEVVGNIDDGIEFFGGSVNVKNAIVIYQGDDGYDVDQSYTGTLDNFIYIGGADSDHALEIDGSEGSVNPGGKFTFKNGVLKSDSIFVGEYADFRDGSKGTVTNCLFMNFAGSADIELDDDKSSQNFKDGNLIINNLNFTTNAKKALNLTSISKDLSVIKISDFAVEFAKTCKISTDKPAGYSKAAFEGWSLTANKNLLTGF